MGGFLLLMADNNVYNGLSKIGNNGNGDDQTENKKSNNSCFKEAVCIDAYRVYDSCADKDPNLSCQEGEHKKTQSSVKNSFPKKIVIIVIRLNCHINYCWIIIVC